jgi:hypothetical protein
MENKPQIETNVVKPSLSIFENETEYRLISFESEEKLDSAIAKIEEFIKNNDGTGKTEGEKDMIYYNAKQLWNQYATILRDVEFTFYLNRKQYQYLTELLRDKLEYDVNTIFLAIELTDMLGQWVSEGSAKDDITIKGYKSNATEITYIYHLISKHKVKGLSHSSYMFAQILKKIGEISKVINYYDTSAKNLSTEIQKWVASWESPSVEAEVVKPSKKKKKSTEA